MPKNIFFLIIASIAIAFSSCVKEDKEAGLEIQPDENRLKINYDTLSYFVSYSSKSMAVNTSKSNSSILLGSIYEDVFGRSTANFVSQFRLSSDNVDFGNNPQIISINAYLDVKSGIEGDSLLDVHFKIFE